MFCDLNIKFPLRDYNEKLESIHINEVKSKLNVAIELGYTHIALNFCPETPTSGTNRNKITTNLKDLNPINLERDFNEYLSKIKLFTRITVKIDDPGQCQNIAKFQQVFDIIAIEPLTEKAFQSSIINLDIDIISFNLCSKFPCFMKHKALGAAIEKGIKFELCYSQFLPNPSRALAISNAKQIIRASRGTGMICSSGAQFPAQLRNVHNVIPLLELIGLKPATGRQMFNSWASKVLIKGRLRLTSYKQTVVIKTNGSLIDYDYDSQQKLATLNVKRPRVDEASEGSSGNRKKLKKIV